MNKGAKGISYTHLVKNNVVPLIIRDFVIVGKISIKRSDQLTFYVPCHINSAKEGLPPRIPCMQAMSPIQGKQNQRIRGRHGDITWIEGPTGRQTASKPSGHRESTWGPTWQTPRESKGVVPQGVDRPHRSVEPTLCWPILAFHMVTPGWSWSPFAGVLVLPPQVVQGL
jgi:hypothetical protein